MGEVVLNELTINRIEKKPASPISTGRRRKPNETLKIKRRRNKSPKKKKLDLKMAFF